MSESCHNPNCPIHSQDREAIEAAYVRTQAPLLANDLSNLINQYGSDVGLDFMIMAIADILGIVISKAARANAAHLPDQDFIDDRIAFIAREMRHMDKIASRLIANGALDVPPRSNEETKQRIMAVMAAAQNQSHRKLN